MNVALATTERLHRRDPSPETIWHHTSSDMTVKDTLIIDAKPSTSCSPPPSDRDECRTPISGNGKRRQRLDKRFQGKSARAEPDDSDGALAPQETLRHRHGKQPEDCNERPSAAFDTNNDDCRFDYAYHNSSENGGELSSSHLADQRHIAEYYKHSAAPKDRLPPVPGAYRCSTSSPSTLHTICTSSCSNDAGSDTGTKDTIQQSSRDNHKLLQGPQSAFSAVQPKRLRDVPLLRENRITLKIESNPTMQDTGKDQHSSVASHSASPTQSLADTPNKQNQDATIPAFRTQTEKQRPQLITPLPTTENLDVSSSLDVTTRSGSQSNHFGAVHSTTLQNIKAHPDTPISSDSQGPAVTHSTADSLVVLRQKEKEPRNTRNQKHRDDSDEEDSDGVLTTGIQHLGTQYCGNNRERSESHTGVMAMSTQGPEGSQGPGAQPVAPLPLVDRDLEEQMMEEERSQPSPVSSKTNPSTQSRVVQVIGAALVTAGVAVALGLAIIYIA